MCFYLFIIDDCNNTFERFAYALDMKRLPLSGDTSVGLAGPFRRLVSWVVVYGLAAPSIWISAS